MAQLPTHADTLLTEDKEKQIPSSETEINPKIASDIAYWSKEFGVDGNLLHEAIRTHGTHVAKIRAALEHKEVNLT